MDMLTPDERTRHLGVEVANLLCPYCRWGDADEHFDTASLSDVDKARCHVCEQTFGVSTRPCELTTDCDGRIFSDEERDERRCLTCGATDD